MHEAALTGGSLINNDLPITSCVSRLAEKWAFIGFPLIQLQCPDPEDDDNQVSWSTEPSALQPNKIARQRWHTPSSPVVVKPGSVTGDDDVVSLLCDVVLGVHQSVDLRLALLLVLLQGGGTERTAPVNGSTRLDTAYSTPSGLISFP